VVAGGDFTSVNGFVRTNLARFNTDGSLDNSFDPRRAQITPSTRSCCSRMAKS
jgi:hypothetical protein